MVIKKKQTLVSKYNFQRREAIKLGIIKPSASETKKTSSSSSKRFGGGGKKCAACFKTVYPNEEVSYEKKAYHAKCLICSVKDCGKKIKQANLASFQGQLICPQCWTRGGYAHKQAKATGEKKKTEAKVDSRFKKFGGTSIQCDKKACTQKEKLYPTSAIVFEKKSFHKACFTCEHPTNHPTPRKLEISRTNYKRHKEDGTISIYCDTCFKALGLHRAELN